MDNNGKITTGWRVPVELKDKFVEFCEKTSDSMEEECAAALYIYMLLPEKIRELAKLETKGVQMVPSEFWRHFAAGLELGIQAQLNIPQQKPSRKSQKKK